VKRLFPFFFIVVIFSATAILLLLAFDFLPSTGLRLRNRLRSCDPGVLDEQPYGAVIRYGRFGKPEAGSDSPGKLARV
jgi:hypothetical protein